MVTLPVMMPKNLGIPPTDNMLACLEKSNCGELMRNDCSFETTRFLLLVYFKLIDGKMNFYLVAC